ncbi:NTP transferase domain-containing protein, partial [Candidatus Woesearchaeota archaeon]|nr:NTP transferase domain-containing protein [Candidatus Woesearchaeota archaeon]
MKVIILSAGRGRRMGQLTEDTPKCLLKVQDKPVLQHQIETLQSAFKKLKKKLEIIVVIGYLSQKISKFISTYEEVSYKINPFYSLADNYMSLWIAKDELDDETLIINGDDLFREDVIIKLLEHKSSFCTVISKKQHYKFGDMKFKVSDGCVTFIDKAIPNPDGENAGLIKLGKEETKELKRTLELNSGNEKYLKVFWLQAINDIITQGYCLDFLEVDKEDWAEID